MCSYAEISDEEALFIYVYVLQTELQFIVTENFKQIFVFPTPISICFTAFETTISISLSGSLTSLSARIKNGTTFDFQGLSSTQMLKIKEDMCFAADNEPYFKTFNNRRYTN